MKPPPSARAAAPAAKSLITKNEAGGDQRRRPASPASRDGPRLGQRDAEQDRAADHGGDRAARWRAAAAPGGAGERAGGDRQAGALTSCEEEMHRRSRVPRRRREPGRARPVGGARAVGGRAPRLRRRLDDAVLARLPAATRRREPPLVGERGGRPGDRRRRPQRAVGGGAGQGTRSAVATWSWSRPASWPAPPAVATAASALVPHPRGRQRRRRASPRRCRRSSASGWRTSPPRGPTIERHGIECDFEPSGDLDVAVEPHEVGWLAEEAAALTRSATRSSCSTASRCATEVDSPLFQGGLWRKLGRGDRRPGAALLGPGRGGGAARRPDPRADRGRARCAAAGAGVDADDRDTGAVAGRARRCSRPAPSRA